MEAATTARSHRPRHSGLVARATLPAGLEPPARCPICGGRDLVFWRDVPAGEPSDPRSYPLRRCGACGGAVTGGDPPGPDAYEAGVYAPGPPRALPVVRTLQRATVGQPVSLLRRAGLRRGSRVLDAGAGGGRLVQALAEDGFLAEGIEPSGRSVALADAAGRPVRRQRIEDHQDGGLDAVVLWHVLEHLDEPAAVLDRVLGWLRPGGLLLVGVPNIASLQAGIAGPGWLHLDVPRHRVHFSPRGIRVLLGRSGFEHVQTHHTVWEHNPAGMWMALLTRAGMAPGLPFHLLKRNATARPLDWALMAAGVPLAPAAVALEIAAAAAGRGGTMAEVAARA